MKLMGSKVSHILSATVIGLSIVAAILLVPFLSPNDTNTSYAAKKDKAVCYLVNFKNGTKGTKGTKVRCSVNYRYTQSTQKSWGTGFLSY